MLVWAMWHHGRGHDRPRSPILGSGTGEQCWQSKGTLGAPQTNPCPTPQCSFELFISDTETPALPKVPSAGNEWKKLNMPCPLHGTSKGSFDGKERLSWQAELCSHLSGHQEGADRLCSSQAEAEGLFLIPRMGLICEKRVSMFALKL